MQKIFGVHFKWFALFFLGGFGVVLASGVYTDFHAAGIDFWTILYYGRRMTPAQPESLYNGFYPFGYAFLIGQMPFTYVLPLSYLLNALLAGLFTASVSTLVLSSRSLPATLSAFVLSIVTPNVFINANTLGPDIGSLAFTAFAVFLLWRSHFDYSMDELSDIASVLVGISLGFAVLFRSHAIVSSIAILFCYALIMGARPFRSRGLMLGAFLVMFSLQVVVNLVSGHDAFETAQNFNIYKFFYGVDWTVSVTPEELKDFSLVETIMRSPKDAWTAYWVVFRYYLVTNWVIALLFLLSPKGRTSRYALFTIIFVLVYAIPVSLSDSARGPILLMGAYVTSIAFLPLAIEDTLKTHLRFSRWAIPAAMGLFFLFLIPAAYQWMHLDLDFLRTNRAERNILFNVEQVLLKNGMQNPDEVYADRYDFYTPNVMPYRSRLIGNWSGDWIWGFNEDYPLLPNDSWQSFAEACREQGIRFMVLSPNSHYRGDFFPPIYNDEVDLNALGLTFIARRGNLKIYEFQ